MPQFFLTTSTTIKTSFSYFFSLQLFQYFNQKYTYYSYKKMRSPNFAFLICFLKNYSPLKKASNSFSVSVVGTISFTTFPFSKTTILSDTSTVCCKS